MANSVQFPRAFFTAIVDDLDPRLKEFYEENKGQKYFKETFYEICAGIMNDAISEHTDITSLNKYWSYIKKQFTRKKKRWLSSLLDSCEQIDKNAEGFPFHNIVVRRQVISRSDWKTLYGNKTVDDIIQEEIDKTKDWAADEDSLFIDYPALASFTEKRVFSAFEADVLISGFLALKKKYPSLDLSDFMINYVDEMGGAYFTNTGKRYNNDSTEEDYIGEIPMSEDGSSKLLVTVSREAFGDNTAITMLDNKDQMILFDIIKRANSEMSTADKPILIEVGELAKIISKSKKPSKKYYEEAEKRCFKIANFTYNQYENNVQVGAVNFLSEARVKENDGKRYMSIHLGSTVSDAIVNNKIRRLPTQEYDRIESKTGRIMVLTMQRERIKAFERFMEGSAQDCSTTFRYNDFLMMVNFGGNNKRKNMQTIKETLGELKDKRITIESFAVDNISNTVKVWFIPLSEDEQKDLSWYGYDNA